MSFSLSGAPSKFQKTINTNLRLLLGKGVLIYLDNFIVMATTYVEHLRLLRDFFYFVAKCRFEDEIGKM